VRIVVVDEIGDDTTGQHPCRRSVDDKERASKPITIRRGAQASVYRIRRVERAHPSTRSNKKHKKHELVP